MMKSVLCALALMCCGIALGEGKVLFPTPVKTEWKSGFLKIGSKTKIEIGADVDEQVARFLETMLTAQTSGDESAAVSLFIDDSIENREGYKLTVSSDKISIAGGSTAGVFYGIQTLAQLVENNKVPCVYIEDYPRFGWRGLHLDVSRHFFDKAFIKRYIDLMALYKYNVFHWHLTDDDGWRIESKKYPKLTEVGAWRPRVGRGGNQAKGLNVDDGKRYGGFYTQKEIKEIVAYAKARNIEILPEIDVPGHSRAIVNSYPEFGTHKGSDVLNIANPKTIKFLEEIYTEVGELFPFNYMHIGCDEVGLGAWRRNAQCQQKIKDMNLGDEHGLHRWLVHHLQKFLAKQGKKAIAWCEVLDCDVDKDTVVMAWRDNGGWIKGPKKGHEVVVTPSMQTYFNYQEDVGSNAPGHGGYRTIMQKVYNFNPVDKSLTDEQKKLVLGGQGCIWTEYIPLPKHVEYIAFPRAVALSEALWSPLEKKDWNTFEKRLDAHLSYLDRHDVQYRVAAPTVKDKKFFFANEGTLELTNPNLRGKIHYTTDGSEPTIGSKSTTSSITVTKNCVVKAVVILPNGKSSYRIEVECIEKAPKKALTLKDSVKKSLNGGLFYRSFSRELPLEELQTAKPDSSGVVKGMQLPKGKETIELSGYINLPKDGEYVFQSYSNVNIFVGFQPVDVSGSGEGMLLGAGYHPITIFADAEYDFGVKMKVGSDRRFRPVKDNMLSHVPNQRNLWLAVNSDWNSYEGNTVQNLFDTDPESIFWANGAPRSGETMTFLFSKPIKVNQFRIETGNKRGGDKLSAGILEISKDGKTFQKVNDITGGIGEFSSKTLKAIRIKCIRSQGTWLVIRKLEIDSPDLY